VLLLLLLLFLEVKVKSLSIKLNKIACYKTEYASCRCQELTRGSTKSGMNE
jgi:hypothetical protein